MNEDGRVRSRRTATARDGRWSARETRWSRNRSRSSRATDRIGSDRRFVPNERTNERVFVRLDWDSDWIGLDWIEREAVASIHRFVRPSVRFGGATRARWRGV